MTRTTSPSLRSTPTHATSGRTRARVPLHVALVFALVSAAACGGAAGEGQGPQVGGAGGAASGGPSASATAGGAGSAATPAGTGSSATPAATGTAPAAGVEMKTPVASTLGPDLQAIGLDAKNLPPIEKLDPKALRSVMKLLAKSLGAKCGDCHTEGDFAAPTRRKKIAAKMWNEFAAKLTMADGAPLFCDSCHQGRIVQLDRSDKKALAKWMDANFVEKLKRKDGKSEECESCHVDMEMHFLAKWGG